MVRPAIVSVLLVLGIMQWDWEQNWWGSSTLLLVCIDCIPEVKTPYPGKSEPSFQCYDLAIQVARIIKYAKGASPDC